MEYGIRFAYDIRDCCNDYLDPPEKTALFSNLLSNGVEAAKDSAEKYIDFSIRLDAEGKSVVITTENSCDKKPLTDRRGRYKTQKENPRIHGLGLRSIAQIVESRKGLSTMAYDEESRRFHHVIYLPNPKRERQSI
ncbi:MAG: GHKL domain-containing protein [Oscillospiraceae bacterium]|nr:GHKL domain-containing protein [Oscillospiraceae bacterium]